MSLIHEYRQAQEAIKELQERLSELESDESFLQEREFEVKLRELLSTYGKSLRDVIQIIDPAASRVAGSAPSGPQRKRRVKVYTNPHTQEVIQTKGGNHKQLREWKEQYGAELVESWGEFA